MIYVSGKITDTSLSREKENVERFAVITEALEAMGNEVHNPAAFTKEDEGWTWEMYLARDLLWICENKPKLFMMNGWQESTGAKLEYEMARAMGLEIDFESLE